MDAEKQGRVDRGEELPPGALGVVGVITAVVMVIGGLVSCVSGASQPSYDPREVCGFEETGPYYC